MQTNTIDPELQVMLCFSYLAYTDETLPYDSSIEQRIYNQLTLYMADENKLPMIANQWKIVWGPVVYAAPLSGRQANMMYVLRKNDTSAGVTKYVVAVRGTYGKDVFDWLVEDFDVIGTQSWPLGSESPVGEISNGTEIGLKILLGMVDTLNSKKTLLEFLAGELENLTTAAANICFTGHSLGATLSSTLAYHLLLCQQTWDPSKKAALSVIDFAGPTAGSEGYANAFDSAFGDNATPIRADLDIAPCFWVREKLESLPTIYELGGGKNIEMTIEGRLLLKGVILASECHSYTRICDALQDVVVPSYGGTDDWLQEALYQHYHSYPQVLGVPELLKLPLQVLAQVPRNGG